MFYFDFFLYWCEESYFQRMKRAFQWNSYFMLLLFWSCYGHIVLSLLLSLNCGMIILLISSITIHCANHKRFTSCNPFCWNAKIHPMCRKNSPASLFTERKKNLKKCGKKANQWPQFSHILFIYQNCTIKKVEHKKFLKREKALFPYWCMRSFCSTSHTSI